MEGRDIRQTRSIESKFNTRETDGKLYIDNVIKMIDD